MNPIPMLAFIVTKLDSTLFIVIIFRYHPKRTIKSIEMVRIAEILEYTSNLFHNGCCKVLSFPFSSHAFTTFFKW
jgi:hypothetical protein